MMILAEGSRPRRPNVGAAHPQSGQARSAQQRHDAARAAAVDVEGGVPSPRPVTRGEIAEEPAAVAVSVFVDWLNLVGDDEAFPVDEALAALHSAFPAVFGGLQARGRGLHGYERSWANDRGVVAAVGGNRGTWFVQLSGKACARVDDWARLHEVVGQLGVRITRVDLAHDDFAGTRSVQTAMDLYDAGAFTIRRSPSCKLMQTGRNGEGGRTFYVGASRNGKMLRVYDKGKEQGDLLSPWVRWEVQMMAVDRVVPLHVLLEPAAFFSVAYPPLEFAKAANTWRVPTVIAVTRMAVERAIEFARNGFGRTLTAIARHRGETLAQVAKLLAREGEPRRFGLPTEDELIDRGNRLLGLMESEAEWLTA